MPKQAKGNSRGVSRSKIIIEVATREFLDNGYKGAVLDKILKEAGGSRTTFYTHFRDKAGLLEAVINSAADKLVSTMSMPASADVPPEKALREMGYGYLQLMLDDERLKLQRLTQAEAGTFPTLGGRLLEENRSRLAGPLARYLADSVAIDLHDITPEEGAEMLLALMKGEIHLRAMMDSAYQPSEAERRRQIDLAVAIFLRGVSSQKRA